MRHYATPLSISRFLTRRLLKNHIKRSVVTVMVAVMPVLTMLTASHAQAGWFDKLVPAGETYTVTAIDRDIAFLIDGFIYDARKFCYMAVGDRVVFFEGRHGIDYYATLYNLDGKERCEVLLRGRYFGK